MIDWFRQLVRAIRNLPGSLFGMLRNERVPPALATQILLRLLGHPDADPTLAITPAGMNC